MAQKLGNDKCDALPAFRALTGCDTTSGFAGRGKRTAWSVWNKFEDVTPTHNNSKHTHCMTIETCTCPNTNSTHRWDPFYHREICHSDVRQRDPWWQCKQGQANFVHTEGGEIEKIPPTKDQHVLWAAYQAGHVWGQALLKAPQLPSPEEFGWKRENASAQWEVKGTNLPPAGAACRAVVKCGCVKGSRRRCKCVKETLPCTLLCKCCGCQRHE